MFIADRAGRQVARSQSSFNEKAKKGRRGLHLLRSRTSLYSFEQCLNLLLAQ